MFDSLAKAGKYLGQAAKLMIGMPDYDNYVEHMRVNHPDQTPMTYEEFFREPLHVKRRNQRKPQQRGWLLQPRWYSGKS